MIYVIINTYIIMLWNFLQKMRNKSPAWASIPMSLTMKYNLVSGSQENILQGTHFAICRKKKQKTSKL